MKTTPKTCISSTLEPQGVFIGAKGTGGQGTNPGPKRRARHGRTAAKTRPRPRFCGRMGAAAPAFGPGLSTWPPSPWFL